MSNLSLKSDLTLNELNAEIKAIKIANGETDTIEAVDLKIVGYSVYFIWYNFNEDQYAISVLCGKKIGNMPYDIYESYTDAIADLADL